MPFLSFQVIVDEELISKHQEWSKVEEEANVEASEEFVDETKELEEA